MPQGEQVKNGKAFEYSLAYQYYRHLRSIGKSVNLIEDSAMSVARGFYNELNDAKKQGFDLAAQNTIDSMLKIEPGLYAQKNRDDILSIMLQNDDEGKDGDVRDVVFSRINPSWEIGFSAKNNNDAVKHSRLSHILDFGKEWVGCPCSETYWKEIRPVFDYLKKKKDEGLNFDSLGDAKIDFVYKPLLSAFRKEMIKIYKDNDDIPEKLIKYLIGKHAFYKIIKDDSHNLVVVKAFNLNNELNKTVNSVKSKYKTAKINFPTRIVEFAPMKGREDTTLDMIMDGGWEISFRIHNADKTIVLSLKFDIQLLGNPPVLFTQHLFR